MPVRNSPGGGKPTCSVADVLRRAGLQGFWEPRPAPPPHPLPDETPPPPAARAGRVSKADLGRSTWMLLHAVGAAYPERPTGKQRAALRNLVSSIEELYPCEDCAVGWKDICREERPKVNSRGEFTQWLCRAHNAVNRKLGKREMDCARADPSWGGLECDDEAGACRRPGS